MKKLVYTFALLAAITFVACSSDSEGERPIGGDGMKSAYYIVNYAEGEFAVLQAPEHYWTLSYVPSSIKQYYSPESNVSPETWDIFKRIALRNGDTGYDGFLDEGEMNRCCFADNFRSIHFVSDADWDAAHPAGSSLDDIVTVMFSTYAPFVQSGYDRNASGLSWGVRTVYQYHASVLTEKEMTMIDWDGIGFYFDTAPDDPMQVHTITVTLQTVDGETLTVTGRGTPPWGDYEPIG
jgi:hypothetical protein